MPRAVQPLPSGTVAFLFTDIEGSTQRWEAHREAMRHAVAHHDALMRKAIEAHGGYIFKTVGDAFCAAFVSAPHAVAAAVAAQRALSKEDFSSVGGLRVRMAVHAGNCRERNGDYFGPTVNRVARLLAIGHGGQVLVSDITRALVRDDLPAGSALEDLGSHRLKDLTEPEHVWQLTVSGFPAKFPPLTSLDTLPTNLPIQRTALIGREHDIAEVKELVERHRLLTLFGAGGVGKTRLALQVGADLLDHHPDGVWFADLAPISDPQLVAGVIAKVVGVTHSDGRSVDEAIPLWLSRKKLLLIIDNCEHVLENVASIADAILDAAPHVRMLTTSREALGTQGEVIYRLPSLALPEKPAGLGFAEALEYAAIVLFVDRAKAADTRFALTDDTAPVVADICRRLDGIPLAIELAAARVKVLSIPNLAQRLDDRFKLLTGGSRSALPRQKTLGALVDWSYDLLTPLEQALFNRVGIFAGGFSLVGATAVCSGEGIDAGDVLDLLSSLTDKSLVVADTGREQARYRLLESTRAYALDKLTVQAQRERVARRHAEHFRSEAQAADERSSAGVSPAWLASVELELDNYRAVLEWALTDGRDVALGASVAGSLQTLWSLGGLTAEGRYWIGRAQAGLDESAHPHVAARLWRALAALSDGKHKYECAGRALSLYQSVGDTRGAAWALFNLGYGLFQIGRLEEASEAYAGALVALREQGDRWGVAACLRGLATAYRCRGDMDEGRALNAQALEAFKALGDEAGTALVLANLAELEFEDGHADEALRLAGEALAIISRGKNAASLAIAHHNGASYRIALGDLDGARGALREGLPLALKAQNALVTAIGLQHFALLAAMRRESDTAARLVGYADAQFKELGYEREPTEKWGYEKLMEALHEHLTDAEIEKSVTKGAAWTLDEAVEEAFKI